MDHGTERGTLAGPSAETGAGERAVTGRVPLAVVVVDRDGLVSHWSRGAWRLFGVPRQDAVGRPALDLLPVSGVLPEEYGTGPYGEHAVYDEYAVYDGLGPDLESSLYGRLSYPAAGRARLSVPDRERSETGVPPPEGWERSELGDPPPGGWGRADVVWWAYPLAGPGPERLLVLAADAGVLYHRGDDVAIERIAPAFAVHTDFPGARELARKLPEILPGMSVGDSARIVSQILELGYPVLEFSQNDRVPVTPDWGVPRRAERKARRERAARALRDGVR